MEVLEANVIRYSEKHGKVPALFIDGADMLAKYEPQLFNRLMVHAKSIVTNNIMTNVFVRSEGSVMPLLTKNHVIQILEVLDISDKEEALHYLTLRGMTGTVANEIIDLFGGRFINLWQSSHLVHHYEGLCEKDALANNKQDNMH